MSEIPNTPIKIQTNSTSTNSVTAASIDASKLVNADSFNSHVLATTTQTISLSVPGQAILVLDISDNKQLLQLQSGQALRVSVTMTGQEQLNVTINKVIPVSEPIAQVPLSRDLANKLASSTKFPQTLPEQIAYIKNNDSVTIGQARRLPNEMIKLVTPNKINISAALPSSSRVPLNQTYTLDLIIAKDGTPQVQFTKLPPAPSPILVSNTITQLASNSPQTDLAKLLTAGAASGLSQTQSVDGARSITPASTVGFLQAPTIDMSLPRNQLWLRYQPLSQLMTQLASVTKEIAQLSLKPTAQMLPGSTVPTQPQAQTSPVKSTVEVTQTPTTVAAQRHTQRTISSAPSAPSPTPQQPNVASPNIVAESLASAQKQQPTVGMATTISSEKTPLAPAATLRHVPMQATPLAGSQPDQLLQTQTKPQNSATVITTPQVLASQQVTAEKTPRSLSGSAVEVPVKESSAINKASVIAHSNSESIASKENPVSHFSLQKLGSLLASLKTNAPQNTASLQVTQKSGSMEPRPLEAKTLESSSSALKSSETKGSEPSFDAVSKLQNLTKQLQHSLPNMRQLTTAPMLPNLIEQFVRFDPLTPASVNLSSLGSLAGALQLLLGGRSALNSSSQPTKTLSPELAAQLKKILQQGKATNKANLTQSLMQLGNFGALKSLEETLTSLSGHLQLYQYQSQEQSSNNQQIFYFTLPTSESLLPQVEGQIEQQSQSDDPKQKTWQLTLLLPIGATDKIKASASLQGTSVEIELVSNNADIVKKAEFFTDFLSQRLVSLGLTTSGISCKQAELPKSLLKSPNQLVELMI